MHSGSLPNTCWDICMGLSHLFWDIPLDMFDFINTSMVNGMEMLSTRRVHMDFFSLESAMILWMRREQKSITLITTEVEYWLRKFFRYVFEQFLDTKMIYCDKKSWIHLGDNPIFHDKSKHIEVQYHFTWDMVQRGFVWLHHISTYEHIAYILTKAFPKGNFLVFEEKLWLMDVNPPNKGNNDREHIQLFPPVWDPRVRNWDIRLIGLRDIWKIVS